MKSLIIRLLIFFMAAPVSTGALAQTGGDNDDAEPALDEVIVTTTRREKAVMDIALSIQAIPGAKLELPTFNDMTDVVKLVPGATAYSQKPPFNLGIQFRGSGITQNIAGGLSPVGYYVDDIPYIDISTPTPPPMSTFDLDRIEIVRGPQGTSYGSDSSAGSVILRTKAVDLQEFSYAARVGVSDVMHYDGTGYTVGGALNMPLAEDVFGVRISYLRELDPGYGDVLGRPDIDDAFEVTTDTIRIKAFWQASDKVDFEFSHSEWNYQYNTLPASQISSSTGGGLLIWPVFTPIMMEKFPNGRLKNDYDVSWTTLRANFDLGFADLTSSTGLVDTPKKETNSEFFFDLGFGLLASAVLFNQPAEALTQEFRLVSTTEGPLQWIAGVFYADAESGARGIVDTPAFFIKNSQGSDISTEALAIFGEIEYAINDEWTIQAGLRYHDEDRTDVAFRADADYLNDPTFGPFSNVSPDVTEKNSYDYTSPMLGVTWKPSENGMVYLTNSTAHRAPIILPQDRRLALEAAGITPIAKADSAELVNWELGTKWTLAEGRVQLEAAYVHADWQDLPLWASIDIPPQPVSMVIAGTDATVETWEFAFNWAVTDNVTFNYAGAFTDTEVTAIPTEPEVAGFIPAVRVGGDLYNYSPATHNMGVSYDRELRSNWEMFASIDYVTRDKPDGVSAFNLSATEFVPAREEFENLSISIGARKGPWSFSVSVDNATDFDGMYFPATAEAIDGLIPPPTTYSVQVSYDSTK